MALVAHATSKPLVLRDPTATLQAALADFENILSLEQRRQFRDQVQNFNQQKPDASSVVRFVAQIDAENHGKTRTSVSNRLCNFLDATRQFTDIVGTFASSNPAIAALVWGGVKTTILVASNIATYFDKVTKTIMTVGQICPVYREFSYLYSHSMALQQALCEYYAVVIRLVTKILEVSRRTMVTGILLSIVSPFESEFGPFQLQLAEASQMVKLQVSLAAKQAAQASAKLVELESRENKQHRSLVRRLASELKAEHGEIQRMRAQESARRAAKTRIYIRDQFSTINQQIPWKQAQKQRLQDTAEWFRHEKGFQGWHTDSHTATLWCPGRMGVGKTVLVSNIIAYLHTTIQAGDVVSYHFCRCEDPASLSARNILGTLVRQILDKYIEDAPGDQLQSLRDACQDLSAEDIVDLLLPRLERDKKYYVVIDGLDECTQDEIITLASSLIKLCDPLNKTVKALYSGRPELEHQLFQEKAPMYRLPLSKTAVTADIERYIDAELDDCLHKQKIILTSPEAIVKIRDALYAGHDGLLLFTRLFIEEMGMLGSENAILKALSNPPRKISDLFATRIRRVQAHDLVADAMKVLRYCGCTKRPLTVNEFSELLSISVSQTSLDRAGIPQNMDQIITACCGLIYVEEEEATVHYVHHSVKHHLFTEVNTRHERFIESEIDVHLAHLCLTYLSFNDFKRQLQKVNPISNIPVTPIDIGLTSVRNSNSMINEFARKLLKTHRSPQHLTMAQLSRKTEDILGQAEFSRLQAELQSRPFHLLDYVQIHWVWHTTGLEEDSKMWYRFSACVRGENELARRPWIPDGDLVQTGDTKSPSSTAWALRHGHAALLLYDVLHEPCMLSIDEEVDVLQRAITTGNDHLASTVVHRRHQRPDVIQQGLYFAASNGHESFLDLFIGVKADVNLFTSAEKYEGKTVLQAAAGGGHLAVVKRLLAAGADVNAPAGYGGRTALQAAAGADHLAVVEELLAAGADVNAAPAEKFGRTALQTAAGWGYFAIVERLLAAGADVNAAAAKYGGRTTLQAAASGGHLDIVKRLLAAKAEVNAAAADQGVTALQAAASSGHLSVVERLLTAGADVNAAPATGLGGISALQTAASGGHVAIVERLLAAGADVNMTCAHSSGGNALQAAAYAGHLAVVEQLLAAKVEVNAAGGAGNGGRTALQSAVRGGYPEVVELLKRAGARD